MVVLDTSIVIDHLRRPGVNTSLYKVVDIEGSDYLAVSVITIQELYEGESTKKEERLNEMLTVLSPLTILEYDVQVAELAGKIARDVKRKMEFADAAIASTAIFNDFDLFTLNTKHFRDIDGLNLYQL